MIIIGITGSIGMGKSTIASMIKFFNIPIHDSDHEVKKMLENNRLVMEKIKKEWPNVIDIKDGKEVVNKSNLGEIIFKKTDCKIKLEKILHPLIHQKRDKFLQKYKAKKLIIAIDVPLLYETSLNKICDYIFLALTTEENQKKRVLKRSNMTEAKLLLVKKNQWSDKMKISQNPYVINTSYGKLFTFFLVSYYLSTIFFKEKFIKI
jgi:dephospho-CoA kinase